MIADQGGRLRLMNQKNRMFITKYHSDSDHVEMSINIKYQDGNYVVINDREDGFEQDDIIDKKNIIFEFSSVPQYNQKQKQKQIRFHGMNAIRYDDFYYQQLLTIGFQPVMSTDPTYIGSSCYAMADQECGRDKAWCGDQQTNTVPGLRLLVRKQIRLPSIENTIDILRNLDNQEVNNNKKGQSHQVKQVISRRLKKKMNKQKKKMVSQYMRMKVRQSRIKRDK